MNRSISHLRKVMDQVKQLIYPLLALIFIAIHLPASAAPISFAMIAEMVEPELKNSPSWPLQQEVFTLLESYTQKSQQSDTKSYLNIDPDNPTDTGNLTALLDELDILRNIKQPGKGYTLYARTNRTRTQCGAANFMHLLANPLRTKEDLEPRQSFIKGAHAYESVIERFKPLEAGLVPLLDKKSALNKSARRCYFTSHFKDYLNKNAFALDVGNRYTSLIKNGWPLAAMIFATVFWKQYRDRAIQKNHASTIIQEVCSNCSDATAAKKQITVMQDLIENIRSTFDPVYKTLASVDAALKDERKRNHSNHEFGWILYGLHFTGAAMWELFTFNKNKEMIYGTYKDIKTGTAAIADLKAALVDIKELYAIAHDVQKLVDQHPEVRLLIPEINALLSLAQAQPCTPLANLYTLLLDPNFNTKTISYLPPDIGKTLLAYDAFKPLRDTFMQAFYALGQIDAYLSVATLHKEFENKNVNFSFATYCTSDTYVIEITDMWNPFMDTAKAVTNDVMLGRNREMKNLIITGSNTGGKSTFMKGTAYSLYSAQTMCIAPASSMSLTPFGGMGSSLNVSDNQNSGISSFKAEAHRSKKLYQMAQKANSQSFVFLIIDELYKGTNPKSGGPACYIFAKALCTFEHLCFMFASHFIDQISKVEADTNGACTNGKFDFDRKKSMQKHKFSRGVSTCDTAYPILKEEFYDINPNFFNAMAGL